MALKIPTIRNSGNGVTLPVLLFLLFTPILCSGATGHVDNFSWRQSVKLLDKTCLNPEEKEYAKEVLRGLDYNSQRVYRRLCGMEGLDFSKSKEAWGTLLHLRLTYEQVQSFEAWSETGLMHVDLALTALHAINKLSFESSRAFRNYCSLPGTSPEHTLQLIPLLLNLEDANIRAIKTIFAIADMQAHTALDCLAKVNFLKDNQARAAESFAKLADMSAETMLDGLALIHRMDQDNSWNAKNLFATPDMTRAEGWTWLVSYFALPLSIQEEQFYTFDDAQKTTLVHAFYEGGEELIWKINNLHAVTDRFGFEVSTSRLQRSSPAELRSRFDKLSPRIQSQYGGRFYPLLKTSRKNEMIAVLRQATAADRLYTAKSLSAANIYALLSRGSELYDSSFRDILVPVLKERIRTRCNGNLLSFLKQSDPQTKLVSSFIVSLAQKGKLTTFFPENDEEQKEILDLVAASAFQDEDSIILFSATFTHLLSVLEPSARSFLVTRMSAEANNGSAAFARLIAVILQYYLQEHQELLSSQDRVLISRLLVKHGAVDLNKYQQTPFAEWKRDGRLGSLSVFHPDDDGRASFISNARTLLGAGYRMELSSRYSIQLDRTQKKQVSRRIQKTSASTLPQLFSSMQQQGFAVSFVKKRQSVVIEHTSVVYSNKEQQQALMARYLQSGDEMFAQRGHSYWRSEQIMDPMHQLLEKGLITASDLDAKQRFLSLGSCGGVKAYTKLTRLFRGNVDILATIGTGLAAINDPYNRSFFEIVAASPTEISWKEVADRSSHIFGNGRGNDYLQPGSLPAILHKILDEEEKKES